MEASLFFGLASLAVYNTVSYSEIKRCIGGYLFKDTCICTDPNKEVNDSGECVCKPGYIADTISNICRRIQCIGGYITNDGSCKCNIIGQVPDKNGTCFCKNSAIYQNRCISCIGGYADDQGICRCRIPTQTPDPVTGKCVCDNGGEYDNRCVSCIGGYIDTNGMCVCLGRQPDLDGICSCPNNQQNINGVCKCSNTSHYLRNGDCVYCAGNVMSDGHTCICPSGQNIDPISGLCQDTPCSNGATNFPTCLTCPNGQEMVSGMCIQNCPTSYYRNNNGQCIYCSGIIENNGTACTLCPANTYVSNNRCVCNNSNLTFINGACKCPNPTHYLYNNTCVFCAGTVESNGNSCLCPTGQGIDQSTGLCRDVICSNGATNPPQCSTCSATHEMVSGRCMTRCSSTHYRNSAGQCVECNGIIGNNGTTCTPCPPNTYSNSNKTACICNNHNLTLVNGLCKCPDSTHYFYSNNNTCVYCEGNIGFNGNTCSCSSGKSINPLTGLCETTICPTGQEMISGTCVTRCPTSYYRVNGQCVYCNGIIENNGTTCTPCPPNTNPNISRTVCMCNNPILTLTNGKCKCPDSAQYIYNDTCVNCAGNVGLNGDSCSCPLGQNIDPATGLCQNTTCSNSAINPPQCSICSNGQEMVSGTCMPRCSTTQYRVNGQCVQCDGIIGNNGTTCTPCPLGSYPNESKTFCICNNPNLTIINGACKCPNPTHYIYNNTCVYCAGNVGPNGDSCSCRSGQTINPLTGLCENSACSNGATNPPECSTCSATHEMISGTCIPRCSATQYRINNQCIECNGIIGNNGMTCTPCPPNTNPNTSRTVCMCNNPNLTLTNGTCKCPNPMHYLYNNTCVNCAGTVGPNGDSCSCPSGQSINLSTGLCQNAMCLNGATNPPTCSMCINEQEMISGECVNRCPNTHYRASNGRCVYCNGIVGNNGTTCTPCPTDTYPNTSAGTCICNNSNLILENGLCKCPYFNQYIHNNTCVYCEGTVFDNGTRCSCPLGKSINPSTGLCETTICPIGQEMISGTCVPRCLTTHYRVNDQCVYCNGIIGNNGTTCTPCPPNTNPNPNRTGCVCSNNNLTFTNGVCRCPNPMHYVYNDTCVYCAGTVGPNGDSCSCPSGQNINPLTGLCQLITCSNGATNPPTCSMCSNGQEMISGTCVNSCPTTYYRVNGQCVQCNGVIGNNGTTCTSCPTGANPNSNRTACVCSNPNLSIINNTCKCPDSTHYVYNNNCVYCAGTVGFNGDSCSCPSGQNINSLTGLCQCSNGAINPPTCSMCSNGQEMISGTCVNSCPTTYYRVNGQCVQCNGVIGNNGTTCTPCPTGAVPNSNRTACVCSNPSLSIINNTCKCPDSTQYVYNNNCVYCAGTVGNNGDSCSCPSGYGINPLTGLCQLITCSNGATNPPTCSMCPTTHEMISNTCIPRCPSTQYRNSAGQCVECNGVIGNNGTTCTPCPTGAVPNSNRTACVCSNPSLSIINNTCKCPDSTHYVYNNNCVYCAGTVGNNGDSCSCPSGYGINPLTGLCQLITCSNGATNPPTCSTCPNGQEMVSNACVNSCSITQYRVNGQCMHCDGIVGNNGTTCTPCPINAYASGGICVCYNNNLTFTNGACRCPYSNQYVYNNTCVNCAGTVGFNGDSCICPSGQSINSLTGLCQSTTCSNGATNPPTCSTCPTTHEMVSDVCVLRCPSTYYRVNGQCVQCNGVIGNNGTTCTPCPTGAVPNSNRTACVCSNPSLSIINNTCRCPDSTQYVYNNTCVNCAGTVGFNGDSCICPLGQNINPLTGLCQSTTCSNGATNPPTCSTCPTTHEMILNTCVPRCLNTEYRNSAGQCVYCDGVVGNDGTSCISQQCPPNTTASGGTCICNNTNLSYIDGVCKCQSNRYLLDGICTSCTGIENIINSKIAMIISYYHILILNNNYDLTNYDSLPELNVLNAQQENDLNSSIIFIEEMYNKLIDPTTSCLMKESYILKLGKNDNSLSNDTINTVNTSNPSLWYICTVTFQLNKLNKIFNLCKKVVLVGAKSINAVVPMEQYMFYNGILKTSSTVYFPTVPNIITRNIYKRNVTRVTMSVNEIFDAISNINEMTTDVSKYKTDDLMTQLKDWDDFLRSNNYNYTKLITGASNATLLTAAKNAIATYNTIDSYMDDKSKLKITNHNRNVHEFLINNFLTVYYPRQINDNASSKVSYDYNQFQSYLNSLGISDIPQMPVFGLYEFFRFLSPMDTSYKNGYISPLQNYIAGISSYDIGSDLRPMWYGDLKIVVQNRLQAIRTTTTYSPFTNKPKKNIRLYKNETSGINIQHMFYNNIKEPINFKFNQIGMFYEYSYDIDEDTNIFNIVMYIDNVTKSENLVLLLVEDNMVTFVKKVDIIDNSIYNISTEKNGIVVTNNNFTIDSLNILLYKYKYV